MGGTAGGAGGGTYYEDVDPRFASESASTPKPGAIPPHMLHSKSSYEDINSGARSPADSEHSNFTSISQRGVNPRWNPNAQQPPPPMPSYGQQSIHRRPVGPPRPDVLDSNPNFQLAGPGGAGGPMARHGSPRIGGPGGGGPGGMVPQSSYPGGL